MDRQPTRSGNPVTLTVQLSDDVEHRLRERASRLGQAIEEYVLQLIEMDATRDAPAPKRVVEPREGPVVDASGLRLGGDVALSDHQFNLLLDELTAGPKLPNLPADFSRAHIYADHD